MLKQKNNKVDNYSLRSSPMIKGKVVDLKQAISEINRILKTSTSIHIDGMDCDISSIDKALRFAEKKKGLDLVEQVSTNLINKNINFKWKIIGENSKLLP
mgnify:CR=1 FL=1